MRPFQLFAPQFTRPSQIAQILAVTKSAWPECINNHLTAIQCKEFIDTEILAFFTERDRFIQTRIVGPRNDDDEWYNAVVIAMDDSDHCVGRDGDGLIYYDL